MLDLQVKLEYLDYDAGCILVSLFSEAFDEFTILANSWRYSQQYSSEIFFVDIDEDGMDAFQQV